VLGAGRGRPRTLELLGLDPDQVDEAGLRSGPGCGFCAQTGYQGRLGLFEVVRVTRKLRELIVARATEVAVKEEAVASGMRSMRADGLAKALAGRTTLEEVLRVTPPDPDLARKATSRTDAQPPTPAQVPPPPRTPPKVLVLDDDSTIAEIAAAVLVDGYEVVAASHLDEGLRMVESEHPDLILVDLELPGADPGELLAILRTGARDLPVLVMSASDDHHTRDLATSSGGHRLHPQADQRAPAPQRGRRRPPAPRRPGRPPRLSGAGSPRQTAGRRCRRRRPDGRRSGNTSGLPGACRR
jgi:CheY-like chemotaxis protein